MATRIAVVGLGPAGVITTVKLASKWMTNPALGDLELIAYEATGIVGGAAFNDPDDGLLLNMPAHTMTVHERAPLSFAAGVDADLLAGLAQARYLPRHRYGQYLRQLLESTLSVCADSPRVSITIHTRLEVSRISATHGLLRVTTVDLATGDFDHVIVAVGATGANPTVATDRHARRTDTPVDPSAPIAIIGSSLTSVDAAVALVRSGHAGPIDFYSRRRTLPSIRPRAGITDDRKMDLFCALTAPAELTLGHLFRTFREFTFGATDFRHQEAKVRAPWARSVADTLASEVAFYESGEELVHATLDATSGYVSEIWRRLSDADKLLFLREHHSRWQMVRHSMPIANGTILAEASTTGQLHSYRLRARIGDREIIGDNGDDHSAKTRSYRQVIDARGLDMHPYRLPSAFDDLLSCGIIEHSPYGGIAVDWKTAQATAPRSSATAGVFVIGGLTRGTYYYVNSIETIVATADRLTTEITRRRLAAPLPREVDRLADDLTTVR